ncbi:MAG: ribosome maturation factor RimP [Candidatus Nanopelagicales bacterium]
MAASVSAIRAGIEPIVRSAGADLEDMQIQVAGRREIVRVVIDRDGGVDLDLVADVSRHISAVLDSEPLNSEFAGTFVLEVTSPGIDRPLTELKHWRRSLDRLVEATLVDGSSVTGRIIAVTEEAVSLDVTEGKKVTQRVIALGDLKRGLVQVEFNRSTGDDDATRAHTTEDEGAEDGH